MVLARAARFLAVAALVSGAACGKSGQRDTNPAELLYRVSGPNGTGFRLLDATETACPATGIQSPNTDQQFGDRAFMAPHFFILENSHQPVRAAFEVPAAETNPIRVDLFVGLQLTNAATANLEPGQCAIVASMGKLCSSDNDCPSGQACPDGSCEVTVPMVIGHGVRIELCGSVTGIASGAHCGDPGFPESFVGFSASLGDQNTAHFTSCNTRPIAEACRTPATLFLQEAKHSVSAVFDTLGAENPDAQLHADLYVDGQLVDSNTGKRNVQVNEDL